MLFNSPEFLLFFSIVFFLYWITSRWLKLQNVLILIFSYVFYGWWDYRFLGLIIASSCFDFCSGLAIGNTSSEKRKKWILIASLLFNLGLLCFFKYFNFFTHELQAALAGFGIIIDDPTMSIVLPVGISFYTFQTLSYTLDVYRGRMKVVRDPVAFFAFVAFFPQLVAGPIERASHLLPQFLHRRGFDYANAVLGGRLLLSGFFKKVLVADTCAVLVNVIFADYGSQTGWTLMAGSFFFAFQIYGDFSGYSDIARGLAKLLGFELMRNFAFPYFSQNMGEFWRRWHISLSTWFRDYVYIPLGGNRGSRWFVARNLMLVFLISGLWHGANWTFILWGVLHALFIMPTLFCPLPGSPTDSIVNGKLVPTAGEALRIILTFSLVCIFWILFRAPTVGDAWAYIIRMIHQCAEYPGGILVAFRRFRYEPAAWLIIVLVTSEWLSRWRRFNFDRLPGLVRWPIYQTVSISVIWFLFDRKPTEFIYFQF